MSLLMKIIAENLANARNLRDLSQSDLGERVGVSRATIARYESGTGGLDTKTLSALAEALKVDEMELIIPKELKDSKKVAENAARAAFEAGYERGKNEALRAQAKQAEPQKPHLQEVPAPQLHIPPDISEALAKCSEADFENLRLALNSLGKMQGEKISGS